MIHEDGTLCDTFVPSLPPCDLCGETARYDAKTRGGSWGYLCQECAEAEGITLGLGKGQRLAVRK